MMSPPLDRPAIVRLYLQAQPSVSAFVHGLVRRAADADDLSQDIGVKILAMDSIAVEPERFAAWCRGVARNEVLHYWRRQRREPDRNDLRLLEIADQAWEEHEADHDAAEVLGDRLRQMRECLRTVGGRQRKILERFYLVGDSAAAIGADLQRSADAVLMVLVRLRRRLRDCIERSP